MSTTIEQLELEVQTSASSAVNGIELLASSLEKLKIATKGGAGLNSIAKQLSNLNAPLSSISQANIKKLSSLGQALRTLSSGSNFKLSSSIPTQITNIGTAIRSLDGVNLSKLSSLANAITPLSTIGKANLGSFISQLQRLPQAVQDLNSVSMTELSGKLTELVSAFSQLSNMGKNNLTSFITQLNKIPTLMENLKNVNFRTLYNQIQSLVRIFTPLGTQMEKISAGFAAFPTRIQKLITSTDNLSESNNKASTSYVNLAAKIGIAIAAVKRIGNSIASLINKSNQYIEDVNLFSASMGQYTSSAQDYAEQVGEIMGIDPGEFMRNQGVFMTLATGFGVASESAYTMSQNLTQLGYDISSFFNISFEDSMAKLQSGLAGELEPLRRIGYDLSAARLQQEAYTLGINKKVSAMTQAEKAELRYYAIMTQVTTVQGDMARTLDAPANQLRILTAQVGQAGRAIGNIFIPILTKVLPYLIAVAKVVRILANAIANLVGFTLPEVDYSSLGAAASSAEDVSDGLGSAADNAKELKKSLLGIDELNVLSKDDDSSGSGSSVGAGGGLGIDLPTYDFLENAVESKVEEIVEKMKEWLGITDGISSWSELFDTRLGDILLTVTGIGTALAAWKIAKGVTAFFNSLKSFNGFNFSFGAIGSFGLLSDITEFVKYFRDFAENGATFHNVSGMISEFAGAIGDAMIMLGNVKVGGALKVVQGIGEITNAVADIANNGVNWDNANTAVRGITNIVIGISVIKGDIDTAGIAMAIQGTFSVVSTIASNWETLMNGGWDSLPSEDKVTIIVGAIEAIGGLVTAMGLFSNLKGLGNLKTGSDTVKNLTESTGELSTTTGQLSPKLTSLAKNLGLGLLVIVEVSAAAIIFAGAIWLMGEELNLVNEAWTPVIANAGTVATAIAIGTALLVAVGLATNALGTQGGGLATNVGIGTAILVELGVATGLFLAEIWAIGKGLDEIGQAWQPVLDNGETIATGIGLGTALLVGIGVVTAALGAATVASAGLLPVAIGLGTAILAELAGAFIAFTESLVAVADEINDNLAPALNDLNPKLPDLKTHLANFTDCMSNIAEEISSYTGSMGSITWDSIVNSFQKLFSGNPIASLSDDVDDISGDVTELNGKLEEVNPELQSAVDMLSSYVDLMSQLQSLTQEGSIAGSLSLDMSVSMKEVGENLVTGFAQGIGGKISAVTTKIAQIKNAVTNAFKSMVATASTAWKNGLNSISSQFTSFSSNTLSSLNQFSTNFKNNWSQMWKNVGNDTVTQLKSIMTAITTVLNDITKGVNEVVDEINQFATIDIGATNSLRSKKIIASDISKYASGGLVNEGQLFIARESGAEMVGAIGNQTAVANNDQIVSAIKAGVYEAVTAAMSNKSEGQVVKVYLDGKEITAGQNRRNRMYGAALVGV